MKYLLFIGLPLFFLSSCGDRAETPINKFQDSVIVKIYDLKDRRASQELVTFLDHPNATYRAEAVAAFASIQDSTIVERLGKTLALDPDTTVRRAAAFTLGQIGHASAERILLGTIAKESNHHIIDELLESYGKVAPRWQLTPDAFINDTTETAALAWAIYRAGFRGKTDTTANAIAAQLLDSKYNTYTRLGAAHYFARGAQSFEKQQQLVINTALADRDVFVRMAAAAALRRVKSEDVLKAIRQILENEQDYRVRVNAVRALQPYPFKESQEILFAALRDKNTNVGIAAAEVISGVLTKDDWITVSNVIDRVSNWRIQAELYKAALAASRNAAVETEIKNTYSRSTNPYQRAALLTALESSANSYPFVLDELIKADTPVVRSSAAAALVNMNRQPQFDQKLKNRFLDAYTKAIQTGDAAVIGTIADALADPKLNYKPVVKDWNFLLEARQKLSLPRDNEALQPLEKAIAYFENKTPGAVVNAFNHPIDWDLIKRIPKDQKAIIKTTRGNIELQLLVEEAPGSVANFVSLARAGYFNRKLFHRVVPNFVIQAGCNRGDGWGSEDYSIRSEFSSRRYKQGSVGMASAGKDTEGTQWFITHSPTPHLDGRYSIFAEVTDGMDVVHHIEVGDEIVNVQIVDEQKKK